MSVMRFCSRRRLYCSARLCSGNPPIKQDSGSVLQTGPLPRFRLQVPEGRPNLAQRFSAGKVDKAVEVPEGRLKARSRRGQSPGERRKRTPMNSKSRLCNSIVVIFPIFLAAALWSQTQPSAVPALPADIPSTADRYPVLLMGNLAGQQAVWTAADGTLHIFFQFNDRGRGPKTTSILKLDANGIPVSEIVTGNDYLKSPVNENYSLEAGTARWKNTAEQSEKKVSGPAYYSPLNGGPSEIALLAHAALQNGGKITLLPEGEARVQRMTELDLEAAGKKKHVTLYAIAGLDF